MISSSVNNTNSIINYTLRIKIDEWLIIDTYNDISFIESLDSLHS